MHSIKNYDDIATAPARRHALDIMEAGLEAIDTDKLIGRLVSCSDDKLIIGNEAIDISEVRNIHVIGFGKASCQAAQSIERILGRRICSGLVIGAASTACEIIATYKGSHPKPSPGNVMHSGEMLEKLKGLNDRDLVIVLVSGGGSALLCWPQNECDQGIRLYEASVRGGMTIKELNTVRKHLSSLKGGGLAKLLYPARVIGLIFSDVPGQDYDMVASGPTYRDTTTVSDAQSIIEKYSLGHFELKETPKEHKWFDRVTNIVIASNDTALEAMAQKAESFGYKVKKLTDSFYAAPREVIKEMIVKSSGKAVVLAGGEYKFEVPTSGGKGGRNQQAVLEAVALLGPRQTFISFASDGEDNTDAAGAIADEATIEKLDASSIKSRIESFDAYPMLSSADSLIMTGPTGSNVSDLAILLTE